MGSGDRCQGTGRRSGTRGASTPPACPEPIEGAAGVAPGSPVCPASDVRRPTSPTSEPCITGGSPVSPEL
jgi:hypothetical protein